MKPPRASVGEGRRRGRGGVGGGVQHSSSQAYSQPPCCWLNSGRKKAQRGGSHLIESGEGYHSDAVGVLGLRGLRGK